MLSRRRLRGLRRVRLHIAVSVQAGGRKLARCGGRGKPAVFGRRRGAEQGLVGVLAARARRRHSVYARNLRARKRPVLPSGGGASQVFAPSQSQARAHRPERLGQAVRREGGGAVRRRARGRSDVYGGGERGARVPAESALRGRKNKDSRRHRSHRRHKERAQGSRRGRNSAVLRGAHFRRARRQVLGARARGFGGGRGELERGNGAA